MFGVVWSCLIRLEGHQTFDHTTQNISFVLVWTASWSNIFGARMRITLAQRLVSIVWSVFDQTCFNRLSIHFKISVFGRRTMFDNVWSANIYLLDRALSDQGPLRHRKTNINCVHFYIVNDIQQWKPFYRGEDKVESGFFVWNPLFVCLGKCTEMNWRFSSVVLALLLGR